MNHSTLIMILSMLIFTEPLYSKDKVALREIEKKTKITCVALTDQCSVCSDLKYRKIQNMNTATTENALNITGFQCASMGKLKYRPKKKASSIPGILAKLKKCKIVSDFCAICADGSYVFTKTAQKIESDTFECATSPRSKIGL